MCIYTKKVNGGFEVEMILSQNLEAEETKLEYIHFHFMNSVVHMKIKEKH